MLGTFWTIRGEHARLIAMTAAIADAVRDWQPPPELEDTARAALTMAMANAMATVDQRSEPLRELLARLGPGGGDPRLVGLVTMLLEYDPADPAAFPPRLEQLAGDPDRHVALPALQWLGHTRENEGDPAAAVEAVEAALALVGSDEGPWIAAILHTNLADLTMNLGDTAAAEDHARAALPVMERLGAMDDVVQLRALLALCAIAEERLADAAAELETPRHDRRPRDPVRRDRLPADRRRRARAGPRRDQRPGCASTGSARRRWRPCGCRGSSRPAWSRGACSANRSRSWRMPTTRTTDADDAYAGELFATSRKRVLRVLDPANPHLDYPVTGLALFGLGAWGLLREATSVDDAVELLVLAERFAYNRMMPTMAWERIAPHAEARAPGRIAALRDELGDRRPPELLDEAHGLVERLPWLEVLLVAADRQRREDRHHDDAGEQRPADLGGDRGARWRGRASRRRGARPG